MAVFWRGMAGEKVCKMSSSHDSGSIYIEETGNRRKRFAKLHEFTQSSTKAAAIMLLAAVVALIVANTGACEGFNAFWNTEVSIGFGSSQASMSLSLIINDIFMAVFFLSVGLEIKFEMSVGQLSEIRQAILPIGAAFGGVTMPLVIYLIINSGHPDTIGGWGVPTATDIAFALGVLSLLGSKVPSGVRVFLSTLAVADDIIAIFIIAIFYGQSPSAMWLLITLGVVLVLAAMNRLRIYSLVPYLLVGCVLWYCIFMSGVHSTISGVVLAFAIPSTTVVKGGLFGSWSGKRAKAAANSYSPSAPVMGQEEFLENAASLAKVSRDAVPPAVRLERALSPWVNFLVLPLFALTNANVTVTSLSAATIFECPVFYGVFFGLMVGKPLGIMLVSRLIVRSGLSKLPENVTWSHMMGAAMLGGVGFTMAIFVANLSFVDPTFTVVAKVAILMGSAASGILGCSFLFLRSKASAIKEEIHDVTDKAKASMNVNSGDKVQTHGSM